MVERVVTEISGRADLALFPELCIEGNDFINYHRLLSPDTIRTKDGFWSEMAEISIIIGHNKWLMTMD